MKKAEGERHTKRKRERGRDSRSCRISDSQREKLAQRETERRTKVQIPIQKDEKRSDWEGGSTATRHVSSKVSVGEKEQSISSACAGSKWWENYM